MMFMIKTYDMIEKKKTLHSYFLTVEECKAICILLLVMLLLSCEQRDPQAEYELLRETVFSSPQEGEAAAQKYIDDFYGKDRARITEASEIRHQYRLMDGLFSDSFSSFVDFMKKSHDLNKELSYSNYEGPRKLWLSLYEKERKRLIDPYLESITESYFDNFFRSQIIQLCRSEYSFWELESVDRVSMSSPSRTNDDTAVKAYGEYRLHLRGVGVLTKTDRITIEGVIGPDEMGSLIYNRTGYQFYE